MDLRAGIAVGSGVIDAYAGWIGSVGAAAPAPQEKEQGDASDVSAAFGRLAAVAGTSTCLLAMSPGPVFVPGVWGPYRDVLMPGYWMAEGGQSATGELIKHAVETHPAYAEAKQRAECSSSGNDTGTGTGANIYHYLNGLLRDRAAESGAQSVSWLGRHFFYYGDLFGNRSPVADAAMAGAVVGLTSDRSVDSLAICYYGVLEFIALQTRQIVAAMNRAGHAIRSIFMSGSLCQNGVLMQLIASACDCPVVIPRYVDAAVVHGAAMVGAKAASTDPRGNSESLWAIMTRMSKPGRTVMPTRSEPEKKLLAAKYAVFLDQCESQQRYRALVDQALAT